MKDGKTITAIFASLTAAGGSLEASEADIDFKDGSFTVKGRIFDKDGGLTDYVLVDDRRVRRDRSRRRLVRTRRTVDRADDGDRVGPVERERHEPARQRATTE